MVSHTEKQSERDGRDLQIHFSPQMKNAFADLAAAVHFSDHFDRDILVVVQRWAEGKPQTVYDILTAFPAVAEETFKHISATRDERAQDAWDEIRNQMPEQGFSITKRRGPPNIR
jgi:hypothetical protein